MSGSVPYPCAPAAGPGPADGPAAPREGILTSMAPALAVSIHLIATRLSIRTGSGVLIFGRSEVPPAHLVQDPVAGAPCEGHDRERRVLVGVRGEHSAVGYEDVLHVPGLRPRIRHGGGGACAHDGAADLVDDDAARGDRLAAVGARLPRVGAAHGLDPVGERPLHVGHLPQLVLGPLPGEPE